MVKSCCATSSMLYIHTGGEIGGTDADRKALDHRRAPVRRGSARTGRGSRRSAAAEGDGGTATGSGGGGLPALGRTDLFLVQLLRSGALLRPPEGYLARAFLSATPRSPGSPVAGRRSAQSCSTVQAT